MSQLPNNFDGYVKLLLDTALKISEQLYSADSRKYWIKCVNKFYATYSKGDNPKFFHTMFIKFYNNHKDEFNKPIFYDTDDETDVVNDDFLRNTSIMKGPGLDAPTKKVSSSWKRDSDSKDLYCKGCVIYCNDEDAKLKTVSVPIAEIYQESLELFKKKGDSSNFANAVPSIILMCLYGILTEILGKEQDEILKENLDVLREYVKEVGVEDKSSLSGVVDIISNVMKQTGLGNNMDSSQLKDMLGNVMNNELFSTVGNVVQKITSNVSTTGEDGKPRDIKDIVNNLGQIIQSSDVKDMIADTAQKASDLIKSIPDGSSTTETAVVDNSNAADQE
jgi:hypothetical protein